MYYLKLIFKNIFRARLRSSLTIVGLVIAIIAFGLLQTVVDAWFASAGSTTSTRLLTRSAISLTFTLPMSYREKIRSVEGVKQLSPYNWFGGVYKDPQNFFAQFAVDHENFFNLYPEFIVKPEELAAFKRNRQGAAVGRKLAEQFGWKVGDHIPLIGTIFPGNWDLTIEAIYDGKDATVVTNRLYLHYDYINETLKQTSPRRADQTGSFIIDITDLAYTADISRSIDTMFKNSLAETLTETERSFQLGLIAQAETIILAVQAVSYVIIIIIMAVVANTMAMTARERLAEYATFKALGFSPWFVALLILGEALMLTLIGALIGIMLMFPIAAGFASATGRFFPVFIVSNNTIGLQILCAVVVGVVAALMPGWRSARVKIVDGLRHAG